MTKPCRNQAKRARQGIQSTGAVGGQIIQPEKRKWEIWIKLFEPDAQQPQIS